MCGIAVLLYGVRIAPPDSNDGRPPTPQPHRTQVQMLPFSVDDLDAVLQRRGPDSLGRKKVLINSKCSCITTEDDEFPCPTVESFSCAGLDMCCPTSICCSDQLQIQDNIPNQQECTMELHFIGATLQLRGINPIAQPLVDASANILIFNGEIFGGIHVDIHKNDGEALLNALEGCHTCNCHLHKKDCDCIFKGEILVPDILSTIRGPWALAYWQEKSRTLWFGRDAFGRRSLLVHWPTTDEPKFMLSSMSPLYEVNTSGSPSSNNLNPFKHVDGTDMLDHMCHWDELPCGIYSVHLGSLKSNCKNAMKNLFHTVRKHEWTDPLLKKLIQWERTHVVPSCKMGGGTHSHTEMRGISSSNSDQMPFKLSGLGELNGIISTFHAEHGHDSSKESVLTCSMKKVLPDTGDNQLAHKVLMALRGSVMRRTISCSNFQAAGKIEPVPVAILFSGGLDSMIIAALVDECLNSMYAIDLLNVSFDGVNAPDRISAKAGLKELQRMSPSRRWQLVQIDAELSNLELEIKHLKSLIHPAKTYMDLNIGIALWLAARGEGFIDLETNNCCHQYKSTARILLVGSGADEQCAGYGRHRTSYKSGSWTSLEKEMKLDMQRIWKRNLGRDDRCISDHGKEARFPFLDEDVINTLLEIPLWEIANLDEPVGKGDKKILREVAKLLGLEGAAVLPKRAIQFGSRIARESNRQNFGSNRAANQASAGSVVIGTGV